jgi:LacI family transcriptional regulator
MNTRKPPTKAPTLQDVARASGLSLATVSRHRSGARQLAPQVQARIEQAVRELGYRDNLVARSLSTGRTGVLGLAVMDLQNPHFLALAWGAQRAAQAAGMSLALVDTAENSAHERTLVEALARRSDGVVVSARVSGESLSWLGQLGKPVVTFGRQQVPGVHSVGSQGDVAAQLLAGHLVTRGYRRWVYLHYAASRWSEERRAVLAEAAERHGLAFHTITLEQPDAAAGAAVVGLAMLQVQRPDVVVAYNDWAAVGFMHGVQRMGLRVPQDVAVAGFDDIDAARHMRPALTTVALHAREQGERAVQRLLQALRGEPLPPSPELLVPQLKLRQSA